MLNPTRLSVKSKLIVMVLVISLGAMVVLGYLGWRNMQQAMTANAFNHLTSIRAAKAYQIETYFQNLSHQVDILSKDESVVEASVRLSRAFRQLNQQLIPPEWVEATNTYYQTEFLPRLSPAIAGEVVIGRYLPTSPSAQYVQYYYIAANENPVGEKWLLDDAGDSSEYSQAHARYHPFLRETVDKFGYYDLFLIDFDSEEIVYSVAKNVDYGANLFTGPYAQSSLARLVQRVKANSQRGAVQVVDYAPYTPAYDAPAAFVGAPIYNGPHVIGIIAIQLPADDINRLLTGNQQWAAEGLGQSGNAYLLGSDLLLRSNARFLLEDPEAYRAALASAGVAQTTLQRIDLFKTSVLLQEVDTATARAAITGQTGLDVVQDYRGIPILSAYQPLAIEGLDWAILTEMDLAEVNQPLRTQEQTLLTAAAVLVLVVVIIAIILSNLFVRPLNTLMSGVQQVGAGQDMVTLKSQDEFGALAETFTEIVAQLRQQVETVNQKNNRRNIQLAGLLPGVVLDRIDQDQNYLIEQVQGVTLMFGQIVGFSELMGQRNDQERATLFQDFTYLLEDLTRQFDLERLEIAGESFLVICGLTRPHLDHIKRVLDFALAMTEALQQFNRRYDADLSLAGGIGTGSVTMGIVNTDDFTYEMWGATLNGASDLQAAAKRDMVLVPADVYERRRDLYIFEPIGLVSCKDNTRQDAWALKGRQKFVSIPSADVEAEADEVPTPETEAQAPKIEQG